MMLRKKLSLMMLYAALLIMLGHNFIPHHHDFDHSDIYHHTHDAIPHNHDSEDESTDWGQLFANFHHGVSGLIFFTSHTAVDSCTKKSTQTSKLISPVGFIEQVKPDASQNGPPYISEFYKSLHYLHYGLRGPPTLIV